MTSEKKESNILKYQKNRQLNIGIVIFGIIFIYLVATIILYITAPQISVYEVRQGSILKDNAYTGLAIRDEVVFYSDDDGYINYYAKNNSKVKVGSKIYTVSDYELDFEETASDVTLNLSNEEIHSLTTKIQSFNKQFSENDFSSTYMLKDDLQNSLNEIASQSKAEQLNAMLSSGNYPDLLVRSSTIDGIVAYYIDGMEELDTDSFLIEHLSKSNYKKTEFSSNMEISSGKPTHKIIIDNNWNLLIKVSEETKEALHEKSTVKVNFKKDNEQLRANLSFIEKEGQTVACLSFNDSMIRYANERYLDVELILEDETGLKIPKSAETSKDFYVVPKTYLTQGGNSNSDGVMRQSTNANGETITEFLQVTVYYEEDEMVYLDPNIFQENDTLVLMNSSELYPLREKKSLKGVYCINKGYAVFKQIQILCESGEYYIIEEGNSFGLSNYDHIALDGNSIKENDVVF